jgi:hypothetical protein
VTQRKTPVPVPVFPSQIPHGISKDRIRTPEVRIPELVGYSHSLVAEVTGFVCVFLKPCNSARLVSGNSEMLKVVPVGAMEE